MAEFSVPPDSVFATWAASQVPTAVLRLLCSYQHPMAEWWLLPGGEVEPWVGRVAQGESGPVGQDYVQTHDGGHYWRTWIECPRISCNYRHEFARGRMGDGVLREVLAGIASTGIGIAGHPSGALMVEMTPEQIDNAPPSRRVGPSDRA